MPITIFSHNLYKVFYDLIYYFLQVFERFPNVNTHYSWVSWHSRTWFRYQKFKVYFIRAFTKTLNISEKLKLQCSEDECILCSKTYRKAALCNHFSRGSFLYRSKRLTVQAFWLWSWILSTIAKRTFQVCYNIT